LSADGTLDPDKKDKLTYKWWIYADADSTACEPKLTVVDPKHALLVVPKPGSGWPGQGPQREVHVILEVWDDGTPALPAYRRAVISLTP